MVQSHRNAEPATTFPRSGINVTEPPKFDLDSYISNYSGRTRFARLYHIGVSSTVLRVEALRAAVAEAKEGSNVVQYKYAVAALKAFLKPGDPDGIIDQAWIDRRENLNKAETQRLETELKGYKNNLIKESIRMGNEELGSHYHAIGELPNATKAFGRMREYCTTPNHVALTSLRVIEVAIDQENWLAVQSASGKIAHLSLNNNDQARYQPATSAALGLCQLHMQDFRSAALSFIATDSTLGDKYNHAITSNDVAVYGGLCALASMGRVELQTLVLENNSFRGFLELESHMRRAINLFCAAKYSQCLEILEAYRADYLLDLHLFRHVGQLYDMIRTKAIVSYFEPFSRVTLDSLAKTFSRQPITTTATNSTQPSTSTALIQEELIHLIKTGVLKAKIDLEHRVLIADSVDPRAELHSRALENVEQFKREAHLKLIRMQFVAAGMEVKLTPKKTGLMGLFPGSGGGGGGGGGDGGGGVDSAGYNSLQGELQGPWMGATQQDSFMPMEPMNMEP